jgi:hypothetical protein
MYVSGFKSNNVLLCEAAYVGGQKWVADAGNSHSDTEGSNSYRIGLNRSERTAATYGSHKVASLLDGPDRVKGEREWGDVVAMKQCANRRKRQWSRGSVWNRERSR